MDELFLMGMTAMTEGLPARLNCSREFLVNDYLTLIPKEMVVGVDEEIKRALGGQSSRYRPIFEVVLDYESGTWEQLAQSARAFGLHENFLPDLYFRSVTWVTEVLADVPVNV